MPDVNDAPGINKLFGQSKPSGRVDLIRKGNVVETVTKGVTASSCCFRRTCSTSASP